MSDKAMSQEVRHLAEAMPAWVVGSCQKCHTILFYFGVFKVAKQGLFGMFTGPNTKTGYFKKPIITGTLRSM